MDRDSWPVAREHLAAERVDLAECDRLEAPSALEPEADSADAAEKVQYAQLRLDCPQLGAGPDVVGVQVRRYLAQRVVLARGWDHAVAGAVALRS